MYNEIRRIDNNNKSEQIFLTVNIIFSDRNKRQINRTERLF